MIKRPKILVTNDDGIFAPGIYALWEAMQEIGDVTIVAPYSEKSAVGHAITITDPIRVEKIQRKNGFEGFAVKGTPADCVKIAGRSLMKSPPDIVVSGINSGANVGSNIIYSGTVSAATEGTILGIPSVAISLNSIKGGDMTASQKVAVTVVKKVLENGLPTGILLNVNVPNISEEAIKGYRITKQGKLVFKDRFEKREDPRGKFYYWMKGEIINDTDSESDGYAIQNDYVSITPIHYQLTEESFIKTLESWEF
ncbi:MAG: 5'/3'-nucleotidase SurE [Candidatus Marinimicrobia bacterium]|nr:5'/3'-nucleotidase SurE [Candidatus Neomarinimicrobiota bacterium]